MSSSESGQQTIRAGSATQTPLGAARSLHETYSLRLMVGYVASLLVVIGAFHTPIHRGTARLSWQPTDHREQITLQDLRSSQQPQEAGSEVPVTSFSDREVERGNGDAQQTLELQSEETPAPSETVRRMEIPKLERAVLEFAEIMPQVVGGMQAFYINIEYPEEAQLAGIEGQLILTFIVEVDGSPSDIRVLRSLHPLCDSAAVQALRATRFMPAQRNGENVRLRMRLPVRFRLVNPPSLQEEDNEPIP